MSTKILNKMHNVNKMSEEWQCSNKGFMEFMEYRGKVAAEYLKTKYGNIDELCRLLKTSPNGLSDSADIEKHRLAFGENVLKRKVCVMRQGRKVDIFSTELVVGDICVLESYDFVPADGVIVESNKLELDESSLTGEKDLVTKGVDKDPVLLCGTQVLEGSGKMLVLAVGKNAQANISMVYNHKEQKFEPVYI